MQAFSLDDEAMLGEVGFPIQGSLRLPGPSHEAAKLVKKLLQVCHSSYEPITATLADVSISIALLGQSRQGRPSLKSR